ncbi:MAG: queuosine precursor transporter [Rhabdochlamydiaceae bacterium]
MNILIFFCHVLLVVLSGWGALRLGKSTLVAWVSLQAVMANLFVVKQMNMLSYQVTCGDVFIIGSMLGVNFLQEFFDKKEAKKATKTCFFCMVFFTCMSIIHLNYVPSPADHTQLAFETILKPSFRLTIASIITFLIVQRIDIFIFSLLQSFSLPFFLRSAASLIISQLIDTLLFTFLGLYGYVASVKDVIVLSFCIKVFVILCMIPLTIFTKKIIRQHDKN